MPRILEYSLGWRHRRAIDLDRVTYIEETTEQPTAITNVWQADGAAAVRVPLPYDEVLAAWKTPNEHYAERFGRMQEISLMIDWLNEPPILGGTRTADDVFAHLKNRLSLFKQGCVA